MNEQEIKDFAKRKLSEKRFRHTEGVAACAAELAALYHVDPHLAVCAGYLHDLAKEETIEVMRDLAGADVDEMTYHSKALLHGPAAAALAKKRFDAPVEVCNACRYHTTGRENMTVLEKIIYVADMIEPTRSFPGIDVLRKAALRDLDEGAYACMTQVIGFLLQNHQSIHENTVKARNYLLKSLQSRGIL